MSATLRSRVKVTQRGVQIALGGIWLLTGVLQFQRFMYSHDLITHVFDPTAVGQPGFIGHAIVAAANAYGRHQAVWNTLAAELQCAIGLGLVVGRRALRPALFVSFGWALVVWVFGEGLGGLTASPKPSAMMGAPGGAVVLAVIGILIWPAVRPGGHSPAARGPFGDRGGLFAWSLLWTVSALLWLPRQNRTPRAASDMLSAKAGSSPHWLTTIQNAAANQLQTHGVAVVAALALASLAVALGVWWRALRWPALSLGIVISIGYWIVGQSVGGPFWSGAATDLNSGPLFVLLAVALFPIRQSPTAIDQAHATAGQTGATVTI